MLIKLGIVSLIWWDCVSTITLNSHGLYPSIYNRLEHASALKCSSLDTNFCPVYMTSTLPLFFFGGS